MSGHLAALFFSLVIIFHAFQLRSSAVDAASLSFFTRISSAPSNVERSDVHATTEAKENNASVARGTSNKPSPSSPSTESSSQSIGARLHRYLNLFALFPHCCHYSGRWTAGRNASIDTTATPTTTTTTTTATITTTTSVSPLSSSSSRVSILQSGQQLAPSSNASGDSHSHSQATSDEEDTLEEKKETQWTQSATTTIPPPPPPQKWQGESPPVIGSRDSRILKTIVMPRRNEISSRSDEEEKKRTEEIHEELATTKTSLIDRGSEWTTEASTRVQEDEEEGDEAAKEEEKKKKQAEGERVSEERNIEKERASFEQLVGREDEEGEEAKDDNEAVVPEERKRGTEGKNAQVEVTTSQPHSEHCTSTCKPLDEIDLYSQESTSGKESHVTTSTSETSASVTTSTNISGSSSSSTGNTMVEMTTTIAYNSVTGFTDHSSSSNIISMGHREETTTSSIDWTSTPFMQGEAEQEEEGEKNIVTVNKSSNQWTSDIGLEEAASQVTSTTVPSETTTFMRATIDTTTLSPPPPPPPVAAVESVDETNGSGREATLEERSEDNLSNTVTTVAPFYPESNFFPSSSLANINFNFKDHTEVISFLNRIIYHDSRLFREEERTGDL